MFVHAAFPYTSQWANPDNNRQIILGGMDSCADPEWTATGFTDADQYRFWARRLCGIACLESVLKLAGIAYGSRFLLWQQALEAGAYVVSGTSVQGLIYRPFAEWIGKAFGLRATVVPELDLGRAADDIDNCSVVMISVSSELRQPDSFNTRKGGHLVVAFGRDGRDVLHFMNPSGVESSPYCSLVPLATVDRFYARRGIVVRF